MYQSLFRSPSGHTSNTSGHTSNTCDLDTLSEVLESFRSKIHEDLRTELQEVKKGLHNVQSKLLNHNVSHVRGETPWSLFGEDHAVISQSSGDQREHGVLDVSEVNGMDRWRDRQSGSYTQLLDMEELVDEPKPTSSRKRNKWNTRGQVLKHRSHFVCVSPEDLIGSHQFETFVGILVLVNAIFIGIEAQVQCVYHMYPPDMVAWCLQIAEFIFMILFLAEWCLKLYVLRLDFFCMPGWKSNLFDTVVLASQLGEQFFFLAFGMCLSTSQVATAQNSVSVTGWLRTLRLLRIIRMARLFHLFSELGMMLSSIIFALHTLAWAMSLMMVMVYAFSVFFAQRVCQKTHGQLGDRLEYFFGDVPRTALTLVECILGGISWDEPVIILFRQVGPLSGLLCLVFVSLGLFVLVNIVTGVFIDKTMKSAGVEEDRKIAADLAVAFGLSEDGITWSNRQEEEVMDFNHFKSKMHEPAVHRYFETIDLEIDDHHLQKFFNILDSDRSGDVSAEEIYYGCLRMRGSVRAVDLALNTHDHMEWFEHQSERLDTLEQLLGDVTKILKGRVPKKTSRRETTRRGKASL